MGEGTLTLTPKNPATGADDAARSSDRGPSLTITRTAGASATGGMEALPALNADAFVVETEAEAVSNDGGTTADASRVRPALEGSRACAHGRARGLGLPRVGGVGRAASRPGRFRTGSLVQSRLHIRGAVERHGPAVVGARCAGAWPWRDVRAREPAGGRVRLRGWHGRRPHGHALCGAGPLAERVRLPDRLAPRAGRGPDRDSRSTSKACAAREPTATSRPSTGRCCAAPCAGNRRAAARAVSRDGAAARGGHARACMRRGSDHRAAWARMARRAGRVPGHLPHEPAGGADVPGAAFTLRALRASVPPLERGARATDRPRGRERRRNP